MNKSAFALESQGAAPLDVLYTPKTKIMKISISLYRPLSVLLFFIAMTGTTFSQTNTSSVQSGPWNDPDTWDSGSVPGYTVNNYSIINIDHEVTVDGASILIRKGEIKVSSSGQLNLNNTDLATKPNGRFNADGGKVYVNGGSIYNEGKNNFGGVFLTNAYMEVSGDYENDKGGEMYFDSACIRIIDGNFVNKAGCPVSGADGNVDVVTGNLTNNGSWSSGVDYCSPTPASGSFPIEPNCEQATQTCDCLESPCNPDILQATFGAGEIISPGLDALAKGQVNENLTDDLFSFQGSDSTRVMIHVTFNVTPTESYDEMVAILEGYGEPVSTWIYNGKTSIDAPSNHVTLFFDIDEIIDLDTISAHKLYINGVDQATPPSFNSFNVVTGSALNNQGDFAQESYLLRLGYGLTGDSTRVGILSDSYNSLGDAASDVASGYLPGSGNSLYPDPVIVLNDLSTQFGAGADEGRAMAHIVHSVAPGAQLYFNTAFEGPGPMAEAIKDLAANDVGVITDDVTHPTQPFFGAGLVSKAIDEVTASGDVKYFTSAGNFGSRAYLSTFTPDANDCHQFSSGDTLQQVALDSGEYLLVLQWAEPFASIENSGGAATDLDFIFANDQGQNIYIFRDDNVGKDPVEIIPFFVKKATTTNIKIKRTAGSGTPNLKYIVYKAPGANGSGFDLIDGEFNGGTITGHAAAPSAFTLGAVRWTNTSTYGGDLSLESFSSTGDITTPGKPDAAAVQGGNVGFEFGVSPTQFNDGDPLWNFFGTSASAPHAAALAALLGEAGSKFGLSYDVTEAMRDNAIPFASAEKAGAGYLSGYGILTEYANPAPNINFVQLDSLADYASQGGEIVINGSFFVDSTQVFFRGEEIESLVITDSTITLTIDSFGIGDPQLIVITNGIAIGDGGSDTTDLFDLPLTPLTIEAVDTFKQYGEAVPSFRYVTNPVLSDAEYALLEDHVTLTTAANEYSNAGGTVFPINVIIDTVNMPIGLKELYTFEATPGNLTIDPILLVIKPGSFTTTYGDTLMDLIRQYEYTLGDSTTVLDPGVEAQLKAAIHNAYMGLQNSTDLLFPNFLGVITNYSTSEFLTLSNFQNTTSLGGLTLSNAGGVAGASSTGSLGGLTLSNTMGNASLGPLSLSNSLVPTGVIPIDAQFFWDVDNNEAVDLSGEPRPAWGSFDNPSIANAYPSLSSSPGGLTLSNMGSLVGAATTETALGGLTLSNAQLGSSLGGLTLSNTLSYGSLGGLTLSNDLGGGSLGGLTLSNTPFSGFLTLSNGDSETVGDNAQAIVILSENDSTGDIHLFPINIITGVGVGLQNVIPALYLADTDPKADSRNYIVKYAYSEANITPADATLSVNSYTVTYGDSVPTIEATLTGLKYEDNLASVVQGFTIEGYNGDVGTYNIVPVFESDLNYNVSVVPGAVLVVQPRDVVITVANDTATYGNAVDASAFTASVDNLAGSDQPTDLYNGFGTDYSAGDNVGTYSIFPLLAPNSNYSVVVATGDLEIVSRNIIVTVDDAGVTYGNAIADSEFSASIDDLASDFDNASDVYTGLTTNYTTGDDVGTYDIYPVLSGNGNYSVTVDTAVLSVGVREIILTVDDASAVYGQDANSADFSASIDNLASTDVAGDIYSALTTDYVAGDDAGTYSIYPNLVVNNNYAVTVENGDLVVSGIELTISADMDTVFTCNPVPSFNYTVLGLAAGDDLYDVFPSGPDAITLSTIESPPPGSYPIYISASEEALNYVVTFVEGMLYVLQPSTDSESSGCSDDLSSPLSTDDALQGNAQLNQAEGSYEIGNIVIKAYPNPFFDNVKIEIQGYDSDMIDIKLMDMMGRMVQARQMAVSSNGEIEMELADLPSGVYFVVLRGDRIDQTLKLIKQ